MIRSYKITVAPATEPVTVAEVKDMLGVVVSDDDVLLSALITAGREHVEKMTGRKLIEQTIQFNLPDFSCLSGDTIFLPTAPVIGITSVTYTDEDGNTGTVLDSSKYELRDVDSPPQIVLLPWESWPGTYSNVVDAVTVTATVGYGDDAADVPESLRLAIMLHVKKHYDQEVSDGAYIDNAIASLINSYIAWWA